MKGKNEINITNEYIDDLFSNYGKVVIEPPTYLKTRIMNAIENSKKINPVITLMESIKETIIRQRVVIAFSLSMFVIILFSVIAINNGIFKQNTINFAETNNNANIISEKNSILANIYAVSDLLSDENNKEIVFSIDGEKILGSIESGLLKKVDGTYKSIFVEKGNIKLEIDGFGYIIAYEGSNFKIDKSAVDLNKSIYFTINGGDVDFYSNSKEYIIETPSVTMNVDNAEFNVSVFDNFDTIVTVKKGQVAVFNNIQWNSIITEQEIKIINEYINRPVILNAGKTDLFVMSDVIDYSKYVNSSYKRLINYYVALNNN